MNSHCNRCGRVVDDLVPEMPPELGAGSLALDMEQEAATQPFLVCVDCFGTASAFRFCGRCGHETPPVELRGGWCAWCRAAEAIPFDEPDDDEWWEGKALGG